MASCDIRYEHVSSDAMLSKLQSYWYGPGGVRGFRTNSWMGSEEELGDQDGYFEVAGPPNLHTRWKYFEGINFFDQIFTIYRAVIIETLTREITTWQLFDLINTLLFKWKLLATG